MKSKSRIVSLIVCLILIMHSVNLCAQTRTITGTVIDAVTGEPISGITISLKGINKAAVSSKLGIYSISVPDTMETISASDFTDMDILEIKQVSTDIMDIYMTKTKMADLSLQQLMNIQIITASNKTEKLSKAPATTIVITKKQISERGYKNMVEVLEELPGIDMSVSWGDTYFKDYWRGYRNAIGSPYLFMIDGVVFNHLYFNSTYIMAAVPLSNIEQIEIVYGPSSSVYGANAFMGVVNIITKKDIQGETAITGSVSSSIKSSGLADINIIHKIKKTRFSLTARYESADLNQMIDNNDFYWLQDKFLTDKKLWGEFVNNPKLGGKFSSPIKNSAIDFRIIHNSFELCAQYFETNTGYGTNYPADKMPPQNLWILPEFSIHGKYNYHFSNKFHSTTTMRYRTSNTSSESQDLEGYNITNTGASDIKIGGGTIITPGESIRILQLSVWQSLNSSRSISQDFDLDVNDKLSLKAGLTYEDKNLQKAYDVSGGALFFPDSLKNISDAYPEPLIAAYQSWNRINWINKGIYLQAKYEIVKNSILSAGYRIDHNSAYGTSNALRAGFIQKINNFNIKLLYGQAYQEPTPRSLYGGWLASGADLNLKPEKSQTTEIDISYSKPSVTNQLSFWIVNNTNTIVNVLGGARNIGERNICGIDYLLFVDVPLLKKPQLQLFYSYIIKEEESKFDAQGQKTGMGTIGDLSHHKLHFGVTSFITKDIVINFKGQYRGKADLVSTNPLKINDGYFVLDGNVTWTVVKGLAVSTKVTNILNTKYFQPGIREADSGNTGGTWNGRAWEGSSGWYNSLLPQPRRCIIFSLNFNF